MPSIAAAVGRILAAEKPGRLGDLDAVSQAFR
jgi:hypothetical protein